MYEQLSIFSDIDFWIAEIDNGCRMWKCPGCGGRMNGQPLHWYQFNYYKYCPYCGLRLETKTKDLETEDVML